MTEPSGTKKFGIVKVTAGELRQLYEVAINNERNWTYHDDLVFKLHAVPKQADTVVNLEKSRVDNLTTAFARSGQVEALERLCTKLNLDQMEIATSHILGDAAHHAQAEIIQWLIDHYKQLMSTEAMAYACADAVAKGEQPLENIRNTVRTIFTAYPEIVNTEYMRGLHGRIAPSRVEMREMVREITGMG